MAVFFVNGTEVTAEKNQRLLRYLRDTLHLTSVKDGCSEGACGACTVLIDGVPIRACTPFTDSLTGRHIITVEGLTDEEKKLYTYAYGEAGAVQCGFCIPGMVLCTKALLDQNLNPTDDQIRYALRNNYCRCTGYAKIFDAVRLAAKCRREGVIPEASENDWKLGSSVHRIAQFPDTLSHIAAAGHEIGLHSSNHDYMQKMDYETALSDLTRCAKAVEDACGVQARLFRPPGGLYGDTLLKAAEDAGLSVVLWSVDPCDWNEAAWDGVLPTVLSEAHDGRIILMHDLSAHSVTCALQAIDRLQARGYTFCTVSELAALRGTALLPGEVYTGFPPLDS